MTNQYYLFVWYFQSTQVARTDLNFCHQVDMEFDIFVIVAAYLNRLKEMSLAYVRGLSVVANQTS